VFGRRCPGRPPCLDLPDLAPEIDGNGTAARDGPVLDEEHLVGGLENPLENGETVHLGTRTQGLEDEKLECPLNRTALHTYPR